MLRRHASRMLRPGSSEKHPQARPRTPPGRTLILESPMSTPSPNELHKFEFELHKPDMIQQDAEPLFHDTYYLSSSDEESPPPSTRPDRFALSSFEHKSSFIRPETLLPMQRIHEQNAESDYDSLTEDVQVATAISFIYQQPRIIDIKFPQRRNHSYTSSSSSANTTFSQSSGLVSKSSTPASSISEYHNLVPGSPALTSVYLHSDDVNDKPFRKSLKPPATGDSFVLTKDQSKTAVAVTTTEIMPGTEHPIKRTGALSHRGNKSISSIWKRR